VTFGPALSPHHRIPTSAVVVLWPIHHQVVTFIQVYSYFYSGNKGWPDTFRDRCVHTTQMTEALLNIGLENITVEHHSLKIIKFYFILSVRHNAKSKRSKKPPPEGWELIEPTLEELQAKMREGENDDSSVLLIIQDLFDCFGLLQ
jgi:hypothetical protein